MKTTTIAVLVSLALAVFKKKESADSMEKYFPMKR